MPRLFVLLVVKSQQIMPLRDKPFRLFFVPNFESLDGWDVAKSAKDGIRENPPLAKRRKSKIQAPKKAARRQPYCAAWRSLASAAIRLRHCALRGPGGVFVVSMSPVYFVVVLYKQQVRPCFS